MMVTELISLMTNGNSTFSKIGTKLLQIIKKIPFFVIYMVLKELSEWI